MFKNRFLVERGTETMNNKYQECLNFLCDHAMEPAPYGEFSFICEDVLDEYVEPLQELIDNATQFEVDEEYCKDCSHCTKWWKDKYAYKLEKKLDKLDIALDRACEELSSMEYKLNMNKDPLAYDCDYKDSDEWKEWLLQDE